MLGERKQSRLFGLAMARGFVTAGQLRRSGAAVVGLPSGMVHGTAICLDRPGVTEEASNVLSTAPLALEARWTRDRLNAGIDCVTAQCRRDPETKEAVGEGGFVPDCDGKSSRSIERAVAGRHPASAFRRRRSRPAIFLHQHKCYAAAVVVVSQHTEGLHVSSLRGAVRSPQHVLATTTRVMHIQFQVPKPYRANASFSISSS
jgi:hypothetical protein